MITFLVCLALLVTAYFTYGRYLERLVGIDPAARTPCSRLYDGVDYVPLPRWRIFLIQLLNIAGLGPIFGAVLGAAYGPVAFLWITFGGIFMGAAHDFIAGVISLRHDGASLPETAGVYLGGGMKIVMRLFSAGLMIFVGAVFLSQPASLVAARLDVPSLEGIAFGGFSWLLLIVLGVILVYYIAATLLPVDKIIGRIYPVFGFALLFMAVGILVVLLFGGEYTIPEFTSFENCIADAKAFPIVPMLFTTIACGAISGFHATQSPLMARCMRNERESRSVFYGAMISESIIALVWAAIAMAFWGDVAGLNGAIAEYGGQAAVMIDVIANKTLGPALAVFVIFGVVACAITSGDTAFRSARLIVADFMGVEQRTLRKRIYNLYSALRVGTSDHLRTAVSDHVELFRVDEPDPRGGDALDDRRLPPPPGARRVGGADSGSRYDVCLRQLYLRFTADAGHAEPYGGLPAGRGRDVSGPCRHDFQTQRQRCKRHILNLRPTRLSRWSAKDPVIS